MARMHSSDRGSSGSSKPVNPNTDWVIYDDDEIVELARQLHDDGLDPSAIGRALRDRYGIPDVTELTGDHLTDIVDVDGFPEDLRQLMRKAISLQEHLDDHPNDTAAERQLRLTESKIRRLVDYYRGDEIPDDWTYNIEKARLVVE